MKIIPGTVPFETKKDLGKGEKRGKQERKDGLNG